MYQLYSEFSVFVFAFLFSFGAPRIFSERGTPTNVYEIRIMVSIVIEFIIFVVQPLLYLHGDSSFRKKIMNQGIWQALKYKPNIAEVL